MNAEEIKNKFDSPFAKGMTYGGKSIREVWEIDPDYILTPRYLANEEFRLLLIAFAKMKADEEGKELQEA